jgi:hypothetical protein
LASHRQSRAVALVAAAVALWALAPAAQAAPSWSEIDSRPDQILDVDAGRILYKQSTTALAIADRRTGTLTTLSPGPGLPTFSGLLTPDGALVTAADPGSSLYEWDADGFTRLGDLRNLGELKVAGGFAIWQHEAKLFRRDLGTDTTVQLAANASSNGSHDAPPWPSSDVAANGDVAMWLFDGIYRYRAGVTEALPTPAGHGFPKYPRTDGTNVVWSSWTCCAPPTGSLRGHSSAAAPGGAFTLDEFTSSFGAKEPGPDFDYRVNGGWIAFTRGEHFQEQVFRRDPAGLETAVSPPGGFEVAGLGADGELVYAAYDGGGNPVSAFLARPGEAPVAIPIWPAGKNNVRGLSNHLFQLGEHWYSVAGGSLRRLQLTDAPVQGSETSIDSGPEGTDSDPTPTFALSSTVAGATFECRVDGGAWDDCTTPHTTDPLGDGTHTFLARAVSPGGAVDPEPASQTWTIDATGPAVTVTEPEAGTVMTDATPHLAGAAGTAAGDSDSVTVDVYAGMGTGGTPVRSLTVTRAGASWAADVEPALGDGTYTARARQSDALGNTGTSAPRTFSVDAVPEPPAAALRATPNPALTGAVVTLDASGSTHPDRSAIVRHEWDLDGDGDFDRDTGAASSTTTSYAERGSVRPAVRVTDDFGQASVASTELSVRPAPPDGLPGVSIDDGARFTRDRRVSVRVVWPPLATDVLLSNDGGFREASTFPVMESVPWEIDGSGSERLPRTIYARFAGVDGARETYQDDIILDATRPRVIVAEVRSAAKRTYRLRIKGRDAISGLTHMQITTNRKKPGALRRYRNSATFKASRPSILVRVRDGAGNWSIWKRVAR